MKNKQTLYLAIDDSGQLIKKDYACFGGIILLNKESIKNFIQKYQSIVNSFKCKYCDHKNNCNHLCPELKHYNLKNKHLNVFLNYLQKHNLFFCYIDNKKIYDNILKNPKSKGRYLDFAIKMMIKNVILNLIKEKKINIYKDLELIIFVDETSYKSNGYYNLKESIYKELKYGMGNIKDNIKFPSIIKGKLNIKVYYKDSKLNYLIQASDLVAGYGRKKMMKNNRKALDIIKYKIFLPNLK